MAGNLYAKVLIPNILKLIAVIQKGKCGLSSQSTPSKVRSRKLLDRAISLAILAYRAESEMNTSFNKPER